LSERVQRFDRAELLSVHKTPEGFLYAEGFIAKPGILTYRKADGSIIRELVPAEELHKADSLGTLGRKPLTYEHPPVNVTADNVAEYGVGDLDSEVSVTEGGYVKVKMAIRRADAVGAVERKEVVELSPGYSCVIDPTPGHIDGLGDYDAIQRDRRYNHTALTKAARGGPDISLRTDSLDAVLVEPISAPEGVPMKKVDLINALTAVGVERADAEAVLADKKDGAEGIKAALDAMLEKFDGLFKEKGKLQSKFDEMSSAFEAFKKQKEDEAAAPKEEPKMEEPAPKMDSAEFLAAFNARLPLVELAKEAKLDSAEIEKLDNAGLRKAIVLAKVPTARKDAADVYYEAAIDMLPARVDSSQAYVGNPESAQNRQDSELVPPSVAFLQSLNSSK